MGQSLSKKAYKDEKGREFFYDNAKYILITLVVTAHLISPLKSEHHKLYVFWYVINTFHMPALIFISGFFAKRYIKNGQFNIQKPFTYIVLYTAAQISVALFEKLVLGEDIAMSYFAARSSLWYLQCLIIWYLLLPYMAKIKNKYMFGIVVLLGILIGYDEKVGNFLSFSRVFVHLPFFMLGYYISGDFVEKIKKRHVKIALLVLSILLIIINYKTQFVPWKIIVGSYNYASVGDAIRLRYRWIYRIIFYVTALVWGSTLLAFTPRVKTFFTKYGARTLQVYILHRFIYLAELKFDWAQYFDSRIGCVIMLCAGVLLAFVLSLRIFEYPFAFLQNIKITKFLKKENS